MLGSKKNKQGREYRSVVVHHRPGRQMTLRLTVVFTLLLVAVGAFLLGSELRYSDYRDLQQEQQRLLAESEELQQSIQALEQVRANWQVAAKVDQLAVEELRQALHKQQQQIADLSEENTFYKGLMAASELDKGLSLRGWQLFATEEPQRFQYKLIVQQLVLKHRLLKGEVKVIISGLENGKVRAIPLSELLPPGKSVDMTLRFKYFQAIEGELILPEGFRPQSVDVEAQSVKPKQATVKKQYPWRLESD